jgi:hypothetical protein
MTAEVRKTTETTTMAVRSTLMSMVLPGGGAAAPEA